MHCFTLVVNKCPNTTEAYQESQGTMYHKDTTPTRVSIGPFYFPSKPCSGIWSKKVRSKVRPGLQSGNKSNLQHITKTLISRTKGRSRAATSDTIGVLLLQAESSPYCCYTHGHHDIKKSMTQITSSCLGT